MSMEGQAIVNEIVKTTTSELILFFVLLLVALVVVIKPLYTMIKAERAERRAHEMEHNDKLFEREKLVIEVIAANTEVIAGLRASFELSSKTSQDSISRLHDRIDLISTDITRTQATIDRIAKE